MPYEELTWGYNDLIPFAIKPGTTEGEYSVGDGICYSTYSLETGSFLQVQDLNTTFNLDQNEKIFIEIDVGTNLGVKNAKLKHEPVGQEAPEGGWTNYPYFYKIEPQDIFENGKVTKFRDGKRQRKCYVLIGYLENDTNKNGDQDLNVKDPESLNPVQILRENVLLIQSVVSGIPCLAPFPYFMGGLTHYLTIKQDMATGLSSSSSSSSTDNSSSTSSS
jgi:hypothetical protein